MRDWYRWYVKREASSVYRLLVPSLVTKIHTFLLFVCLIHPRAMSQNYPCCTCQILNKPQNGMLRCEHGFCTHTSYGDIVLPPYECYDCMGDSGDQ